MKRILIFALCCTFGIANTQVPIEKQLLRGALSQKRNYDVLHYHLNIDVDIANKSISGSNRMTFKASEYYDTIQIDLFSNMQIHKIMLGKKSLSFTRKYDAVFVPIKMKKGGIYKLDIQYSGKPFETDRAPWEGGFIWSKDEKGNPWVGVACEGDGASLWWPNKDHLSDEPDSMLISISVPKPLQVISNGQLRNIQDLKDKHRFHWAVTYPINNYNVSINIGKYAHFTDMHTCLDSSTFKMNYYVLDYNLDKAKQHFKQAHTVLECFEYYLGKYPFARDGYALIETPYLGMEHQSGIAYGNKYQRGYLGSRIPEDMDFDYIILHESGHEYFGNAVSCNDHAEMWIHESFTTYMEALYVEYIYTKPDAQRYLNIQREWIKNVDPMVGPLNINYTDFKSSDNYYKGSWMLHTLRSILNNDALWFDILKELYNTYKYKHVTSKQIIDFIQQKSNRDLSGFFNQYLYTAEIPTLEYKLSKRGERTVIEYQWKGVEEGFEMQFELSLDGRNIKIPASSKLRNTEFQRVFTNVKILTDGYLINTKEVKEISD